MTAALCLAWLDKLYFRPRESQEIGIINVENCENIDYFAKFSADGFEEDSAHPISRAFYSVLATVKAS